jgi:hypothetical protein
MLPPPGLAIEATGMNLNPSAQSQFTFEDLGAIFLALGILASRLSIVRCDFCNLLVPGCDVDLSRGVEVQKHSQIQPGETYEHGMAFWLPFNPQKLRLFCAPILKFGEVISNT